MSDGQVGSGSGSGSGSGQPGATGQPGVGAVAPPAIPLDVWRSQLPSDLAGEDLFARTLAGKSTGEVLRVLHDTHKEVGRRIPPDQAVQFPKTPDAPEWEAIYGKLRPAEATGYALKAPASLGWDDAAMANVKQGLWEAGLSNGQAEKLLAFLGKGAEAEQQTEQQALAAQRQADETALRQKFGAEYDARMEWAGRIAKEFGAEEHLAKLGLDRDPVLVPILAALGSLLQEGRFHSGSTFGAGSPMTSSTPEQLQTQIDSLRNSDRFKQGDPSVAQELLVLTEQRERAKAAREQAGALAYR